MQNSTLSSISSYTEILLGQLFGKLILALIILLIGFIFGRVIGKILHRILHEIQLDKTLKKTNIHFALEKTISNIVTYFIYFISLIWALNELGLTTTVLNMISAAALILIILSILLAIKDFIPNIISGFYIYQGSILKEGQKISIDNLEGTIRSISLLETQIETSKGDTIHIPNSVITKKEFIVKNS